MPSIRDAGPVLEGWFWQALLDEPPHIAWVGHVEVLALQNRSIIRKPKRIFHPPALRQSA